jgi:ABC-type transport system substrate-binding protein
MFSTRWAEFPAMTQIYQADLASIGVTLNLKSIDSPGFIAQAVAVNYQLAFNRNTGALTQSAMLNGAVVRPMNNLMGYRSDTYRRLIQSLGTELDATRRKAIYNQINGVWLDECFSFRSPRWQRR